MTTTALTTRCELYTPRQQLALDLLVAAVGDASTKWATVHCARLDGPPAQIGARGVDAENYDIPWQVSLIDLQDTICDIALGGRRDSRLSSDRALRHLAEQLHTILVALESGAGLDDIAEFRQLDDASVDLVFQVAVYGEATSSLSIAR